MAKEREWERVFSPFELDLLPRAHIRHLGIIPEKDHPGYWRLIMNLSCREKASMNNGIEPELCMLYVTC